MPTDRLPISTTTVTSADRLTVTTTLDDDGDGVADQRQTYVRNADGSNTTTTEKLSINGTVMTRTTVETSANGLTKTTSVDVDANGTVEDIVTETTVIGSDGTRTKTVDDKSSAGKLAQPDDCRDHRAPTTRPAQCRPTKTATVTSTPRRWHRRQLAPGA